MSEHFEGAQGPGNSRRGCVWGRAFPELSGEGGRASQSKLWQIRVEEEKEKEEKEEEKDEEEDDEDEEG